VIKCLLFYHDLQRTIFVESSVQQSNVNSALCDSKEKNKVTIFLDLSFYSFGIAETGNRRRLDESLSPLQNEFIALGGFLSLPLLTLRYRLISMDFVCQTNFRPERLSRTCVFCSRYFTSCFN